MKNHWLLILFAFLLLGSAAQVQAQEDDFDDEEEEEVTLFKKEKKFDPRRLRVGFFPEFSLSSDVFGNTALFFSINPSVSYLIGDRFEPGVGFVYGYLSILNVPGAKIHTYGTFQDAKVFVWEGLFLYQRGQIVSETNLVARIDNQGRLRYEQQGRRSAGNVFLGGGYDFELGERSVFSIFVMINLLTNQNFPDRRPNYGMRFSFGLGRD